MNYKIFLTFIFFGYAAAIQTSHIHKEILAFQAGALSTYAAFKFDREFCMYKSNVITQSEMKKELMVCGAAVVVPSLLYFTDMSDKTKCIISTVTVAAISFRDIYNSFNSSNPD